MIVPRDYQKIIRLFLFDSGMKQYELAEHLQLSTASIGRWLRGTHKPTPRTWKMFLEVLASMMPSGGCGCQDEFERMTPAEWRKDQRNFWLRMRPRRKGEDYAEC